MATATRSTRKTVDPRDEEYKAEKSRLRKLFPIGSSVTTTVTHVSRSGMSRSIKVLAYDKVRGEIVDVTSTVAKVLGERMDYTNGGMKISGAGMDMCFSVTYDLGATLYRDSKSKKLQNNRNPHPGYALKQNTV